MRPAQPLLWVEKQVSQPSNGPRIPLRTQDHSPNYGTLAIPPDRQITPPIRPTKQDYRGRSSVYSDLR